MTRCNFSFSLFLSSFHRILMFFYLFILDSTFLLFGFAFKSFPSSDTSDVWLLSKSQVGGTRFSSYGGQNQHYPLHVPDKQYISNSTDSHHHCQLFSSHAQGRSTVLCLSNFLLSSTTPSLLHHQHLIVSSTTTGRYDVNLE